MYSFDGECIYKLTGECVDDGFSIHLNNSPEGSKMNIYFSGQEIVMEQGQIKIGSISLKRVELPSVVSGVVFEKNVPVVNSVILIKMPKSIGSQQTTN